MTDLCFTPPKLAERWGVSPDKIVQMIRSGKLAAFDVSLGSKRPRFRISPEVVAEFEEGRTVAPKIKSIRRKRRDKNVIQFF